MIEKSCFNQTRAFFSPKNSSLSYVDVFLSFFRIPNTNPPSQSRTCPSTNTYRPDEQYTKTGHSAESSPPGWVYVASPPEEDSCHHRLDDNGRISEIFNQESLISVRVCLKRKGKHIT